SWDAKTPPDEDVLRLIDRAGTDLVPRPNTPEGRKSGIQEQTGRVSLEGKNVVPLVQLTGPSMLRALEISIPRERALAFSRVRLRVTWDGRSQPSIDAPIALFYAAGILYNRDEREYLVKGFPVHVRYDTQRVHLTCYFPMPFFRSAHIELAGVDSSVFPDVF